MDSAEKTETPFTTTVALVTGLAEALEMIHEEGLPRVLARHARLCRMLRDGWRLSDCLRSRGRIFPTR